jgi:DNA-binding winged helix-turn-helix (wHTH) protein/TolB-like protein
MDEQNGYVLYEFGPFRVDRLRRRLFREGAPVQLASKAFETLAVLLDNRGTTVSKFDLMNLVWGETAVEENNLTQQISTLRKALGERAGEHKFIVTVPGQGYCFVAAVREVPAKAHLSPDELTEEPDSVVFERRRHFRDLSFDPNSLIGSGLAITYVLVVCVAVFVLGYPHTGPNQRPQSVAVLAFKSLNTNDQSLSAGIRDTLRARLGSVEDVSVLPTDFDPAGHDPLDAGRQLHADVVLSGSIQREENRIRVAVEMVDVAGERIVWGKTFDENLSNVFDLQDAIAGEVILVLQNPRSSSQLYLESPVSHSLWTFRDKVLESVMRQLC